MMKKSMINKNAFSRTMSALITLTIGLVFNVQAAVQSPDPLPSWKDGELKIEIVRFVTRVTTKGSPDFVPSEQRIATFDQDGTLWSEQPVVHRSNSLSTMTKI
jgi:hypothetical protein